MSENKILRQCFDKEELSDKKRPDTVRSVSVCLPPTVFSSISFSQHNKQRCVSLSYGERVVCWLPLPKECPDTHTQPGPVLHTGPSVLDWAGQPLLL